MHLPKTTSAVAKARAYARASARRHSTTKSPTVSAEMIQSNPGAVASTLAEIRLRQPASVERYNGQVSTMFVPEVTWRELMECIRIVCAGLKAGAEMSALDWEALCGRIGHGELGAWIALWRSETAKAYHRWNGKAAAVYRRVADALAQEKYTFQENLPVVNQAFRMSANNPRTSYTAINVLIKQLQFWLPVFSREVAT